MSWTDKYCMAATIADKLMLKLLGALNEAQGRWFVAREAIPGDVGGFSNCMN